MDRLYDISLSGMGIGSASLYIHQSGEATVLRRLAELWPTRDDLVVLDVGAHAGGYALEARSAFGSTAHIQCFEPNPALFDTLASRLRDDQGTICHQAALGAQGGSAPLFLDKVGSSRGSLVEESFTLTERPVEQTHIVEVRTLDDVARSEGLAQIDLLKLDVEGHELAVLQGASVLLSENRIDVVQFEFGERNLASRTYMRDFFELLGPRFAFFRVTPRGLVPLEYRPKVELFALETNYLAVAGTVPVSG